MRRILLFIAIAALVASASATAQPRVIPEFRPFVGAFIPTGDQRDVMEDALLVGGQVAFEMADMVHLVGTLGYTTPNAARPTVGNDIHVFQYDVGAELFRPMPMASGWNFRPFLGAGLGARTHDFKDRNTDAETNLAGYGALGAEFQTARIALRLEGRDYITRFKGLLGNEKAAARNDLMVSAGVAIHLW